MSLVSDLARLLFVGEVAEGGALDGTDNADAEILDDANQPLRVFDGGGTAGFYSLVATGAKALVLRTPLGGWILRCLTPPAPGAVAGEAGITIAGTHLRFLPTGNLRLESSGGTVITVDGANGDVAVDLPAGRTMRVCNSAAFVKKVARNDDVVVAAGAVFLAWVAGVDAVCRAINPLLAPAPVAGIQVGTVTATSDYLRAQ
jgi:hypothetical protein